MMPAEATGALARFQDAFAHALRVEASRADATVAALVTQPAFAVYRNTVAKGCIDALQANFPAVARLVGEEWFRAAAAAFVEGERPSEPSLLAYGATFPEFLAGFPPAAQLPYLPDVARLDRKWTLAHVAADAPALERTALATGDPEALGNAVLHPHPAALWDWFADAPIFTIWSRNRGQDGGEYDLDWRGEGALLTRPLDAVRLRPLDAAACRFLDACALGLRVREALEVALEADAGANLVGMLSGLFDAGTFSRITFSADDALAVTLP